MKSMNYSSQSVILAFSALLTTLWILIEGKRERVKSKSKIYKLPCTFPFFPYSLLDMQNGGRWRNLVSR